MHWKFTRPALLFLLSSFTFGMGAAQLYLYLNFYLETLHIARWAQGVINALPGLAFIAFALPGAWLASRIGYTRLMQLGGLLTLLGLVGVALSSEPVPLGLAVLLEGVGAALLGIAGAPFMTAHSNDANRVALFSLQLALVTGAGFLGNLLGGYVPKLYAAAQGVAVDGPEAVRVALLCGAAFQLLSLIPALFIPATRGAPRAGGRWRLERPRQVVAFVLPSVLVGLGAGLTIPYLNVFLEGRFHVPFSSLGALFAWTSLATAVTALVQPRLVRALGEVRTVLLVQGLSLPFLAALGFAPSLLLVSAALFVRGALMNASGPVYSAYTMKSLSERDRGFYAALNPMVWNAAWALGNLISGGGALEARVLERLRPALRPDARVLRRLGGADVVGARAGPGAGAPQGKTLERGGGLAVSGQRSASAPPAGCWLLVFGLEALRTRRVCSCACRAKHLRPHGKGFLARAGEGRFHTFVLPFLKPTKNYPPTLLPSSARAFRSPTVVTASLIPP